MLLRSRQKRLLSPPGPRLLADPVLALVRRVRTGRRGLVAVLNLGPLSSVLSLLVFYLLPTFSPEAELLCTCHRPQLPKAWNGEELEEAPVLQVHQWSVSLNGLPYGEPGNVDSALLAQELSAMRAGYPLHHPGAGAFPGKLLMEADARLPYGALRPIMATAAAAGYPHISLMVRKNLGW